MKQWKLGLRKIKQERREQIEKHGKSILHDIGHYQKGQLATAARVMMQTEIVAPYVAAPDGWDRDTWSRMCGKEYIDRLVIAGALISAEIDRLHYTRLIEINEEAFSKTLK